MRKVLISCSISLALTLSVAVGLGVAQGPSAFPPVGRLDFKDTLNGPSPDPLPLVQVLMRDEFLLQVHQPSTKVVDAVQTQRVIEAFIHEL